MKRLRIDTEFATKWAREVYDRAVDHDIYDWRDSDLQEYNIAHGIVLDGIYQDTPPASTLRWGFWPEKGGAQ